MLINPNKFPARDLADTDMPEVGVLLGNPKHDQFREISRTGAGIVHVAFTRSEELLQKNTLNFLEETF